MAWVFAWPTTPASRPASSPDAVHRVIEARVKDLGIHFLQQNALEKIEPYDRICNAAQVEDAEVCYVGDDLTDLPLLTRVGLGVCVANGDDLVRKHAHFCTLRAGGSGAVREAIELILTAQGKWDAYPEILPPGRPRHKPDAQN